MSGKFKHYPEQPAEPECEKAFLILCRSHDAAGAFLEIFSKDRRRGTPTDEEQDLLRAMLVFAAAGLDSMVKQLVKDGLPLAIDRDSGALSRFKQYIERRLSREEKLDRQFLADILGDPQPRRRLAELLIEDLTSRSLQSCEELLRTAAFFGIPSREISDDIDGLGRVFHARNQISHEMDIDFSQKNRRRRPRSRELMVRFTEDIFRVATNFLTGVDARLGKQQA
jgi:hypothetical protein